LYKSFGKRKKGVVCGRRLEYNSNKKKRECFGFQIALGYYVHDVSARLYDKDTALVNYTPKAALFETGSRYLPPAPLPNSFRAYQSPLTWLAFGCFGHLVVWLKLGTSSHFFPWLCEFGPWSLTPIGAFLCALKLFWILSTSGLSITHVLGLGESLLWLVPQNLNSSFLFFMTFFLLLDMIL